MPAWQTGWAMPSASQAAVCSMGGRLSAGGKAAVDHEDAAGGVARLGRDEEGDHRGDLLEAAQATQRDLPDQATLAGLVVDLLDVGRRLQRAGADDVAADALRGVLHGEGATEREDAALAGGVGGVLRR